MSAYCILLKHYFLHSFSDATKLVKQKAATDIVFQKEFGLTETV